VTRFCRLLAALLLVLVASAPAPAAAQAAAHTRVALVAPQHASREAREVLVRAQGELVAAGFEVVPVTAAAGVAPEGMLARASREAGAVAALGVAEAGHVAWVWAPDPETSAPSLEAIECRGEPAASSAATLAIRAVELLRVRLQAASEPPAQPAQPAERPGANVPVSIEPHEAPRLELAVGFAARFAWGGLEPSFGPQLSAGLATASGWLARVRFLGPLRGDTAASSGGQVAVEEALGLLEAGRGLRLDALPMKLVAALGLGVAHTTVEGAPALPLEPRRDDAWAALGALTAEVSYYPTDFAFVSLDGALLLSAPRLNVALAGETLGTLGRPSLTLGARAGVSF
jgi:hypothetical protein